MRKILTLSILALLLGVIPAFSQEALTVRGMVTTRDDGQPLPGATVSIPSLNLSTTTDANGRYEIDVPQASLNGETVDLVVEFQGLQTRTTQVRLSSGASSKDFALAVGFGQEITVGSRAIGAAEEKAVPVDVLTQEQLESTGRTETSQIIQALAPSFNFPRPTITDGTDTVRPATLRGLGPDQMLVLINGKRRHSSALVHSNNSIGRGSTGVDLNAIPAAAIENVEILRDGAAAQYGSDAIAGVLNLVLKSGATSPAVSVKGGATTHGDGELLDVDATYGMSIGRGSLFGVLEYRDRTETNRASPDPREQIVPGDGGNNQVKQPNHHWGDSDSRDIIGFLNLNVPISEDDRTYFYAFGGWGDREGSHGGFYRRALDARNHPQIYPEGFLPLIEPSVNDESATVGARGDMRGWFWDASTQYGHNEFAFNVTNSLNASLGPTIPPNQTSFYAGAVEFGQMVTNVDFSRGFNVGLAGPLNIAFGAEHRRENYQIHAGEPASYIDGGLPNQTGGRAAPGAQVFPGFKPDNEVDKSRSNVGLYADLEGDVLQKLRMGLAVRYEDYDDFGSTSDGKLTARFAPVEQFLVRAAISTGFRAPSLVQSYHSATSTNFLRDPATGQLAPFEVGTFPVSSTIARSLGATDLKPEDSKHLSAGVVWEPVNNLEITADVYHIEIDDRIVFSGNFTGGSVAPLLAPFGVAGARFFTNAIDTETDGFDIVVNHQRQLFGGRLDLSAAYSNNETEIASEVRTPPQLAGLGEVLFDRIERRRIECGQPHDSIRLLQQLFRGGFTGTLRESRYGEYCSFSLLPQDDQTYGAEWITDLEAAYAWGSYKLAIGAENLFDVFPDENLPNSPQGFSGIFTYPSQSPFGMNGRFVYSRLSYTF